MGVLVPSSNTVVERDAALLPPGVSAHFSRMAITRDDEEQLAALLDLAPAAAELLAHAGVRAIAFACTTGSLHGGPGYDRRVIERILEVTGTPATTTATALLEALGAEGVGRVALVSPYEPWLEAKVVAFLEAAGVAVEGRVSFDLPDPRHIGAVAPEHVAAAILRVDTDRADAVVVSCTALRGVEAARLVASRLGKPVLTSNQATYWKLLELATGARTLPSTLVAPPVALVGT